MRMTHVHGHAVLVDEENLDAMRDEDALQTQLVIMFWRMRKAMDIFDPDQKEEL